MNKSLNKIFLILALVILGIIATGSYKTLASATSGDVWGWLWGGSVNDLGQTCTFPQPGTTFCGGLGWTSISSDNSYSGHDPNGTIYGINVPTSDGPVTGEVWNSNVGWINFGPTSGFPTSGCNPSCPTTGVVRNGTNLEGWAQIDSIASENLNNNSGGWSGWLKMSGTANDGSKYGVMIDSTTGAITGIAWSEELGWLSFDGTLNPPTLPPPPPATTGLDVICSGSPNPAYLTAGGKVTWSATVISPGTPPYSYAWSFTPTPDTSSGSGNTIEATYLIAGEKDASITVTDDAGTTASANCSVNVLKTNKLKEIIPFLPFNYKGSRHV